MKKILLVGELNKTVSGVNKHLATRFQTQVCVGNLEMVKGMVKVFDPDMVVACLVGIGELDKRILDYFAEEHPDIPVLLIGIMEECSYYQKYYESKQFDFAIRPTTLSVLLQKCQDMLRITDFETTENECDEENEVKKRRHILAVDDSGVLLRSVKAILEKDYDVNVATSGQMAIKQAKKRIPDLILLDYEMPNMDGKQTLEEIRKDDELANIPVVFLTGVADKQHISAVLGLNPAGYLLKPIDQKRLIDTIEAALIGI